MIENLRSVPPLKYPATHEDAIGALDHLVDIALRNKMGVLSAEQLREWYGSAIAACNRDIATYIRQLEIEACQAGIVTQRIEKKLDILIARLGTEPGL